MLVIYAGSWHWYMDTLMEAVQSLRRLSVDVRVRTCQSGQVDSDCLQWADTFLFLPDSSPGAEELPRARVLEPVLVAEQLAGRREEQGRLSAPALALAERPEQGSTFFKAGDSSSLALLWLKKGTGAAPE